MRVLHVVKGFGPGGAERLIVSLIEARGPDVEVEVAYLLPHKDHLLTELADADIATHLLGTGLGDPRWPQALRRLAREGRFDIVHLHSPAVASLARVALRTMADRPVIVSTEHNVWPSFSAATRLSNGLTSPLDDLRIAVSDEVRSSAWRWQQGDLRVLVHGVPLARVAESRGQRADMRRALGIDHDAVVVLTVANFREKKDYPTLLAAAARCLDHPRLEFLAVGQGPLEADLRARRDAAGLGERFRFLGYRSDATDVMAAADIFTLTSIHEGLPISLLEAMAVGLPPVVSAVGGIPEVVSDQVDGLLVDAGDVDGFAAAFRRLADDGRSRQALAAAAMARARDFDIANAATTLERWYREVLDRPT